MKKILAALCGVALTLNAFALTTPKTTAPYTPAVDPGTTNIIVFPVQNAFACAATVAGTPLAWYYSTLTLTNLPTTNTAQTLGVFFNGTNRLYTWTNTPGLVALASNLPATMITIGVTNSTGDAGTASNTLALTLGSGTTYYVLTNAPGQGQILASNAPADLATNLYNFFAGNFPSFSLAWKSAQIFTLTTATNDNVSLTNTFSALANSSFTNTPPVTVYLSTNLVSTNLFYLVAGTNVATSTTNLATVLQRDYPNLMVGYLASNKLSLATYGVALAVTNGVVSSVGWGTNTVTTNTVAASGPLVITAAVGVNGADWVPFPALNMSLALTGTNVAGTNALLQAWSLVRFTIFNPSTNAALPDFRLSPTSF